MATAGDTEVTLSWTVPGSDGGSAVTEYQYRVSDDAGSTWSPDWTDVPDGSDSGADRSDERSYTVTGLDNGVLHTFEVRAVNHRPGQRRRAHLRGESGQCRWRRRPGLGHVDSDDHPDAAAEP
jgi:hypothetical protein